MTTQEALKNAKRCHKTMMDWIKEGDLGKARYVKGYRNQWLAIARNPETF